MSAVLLIAIDVRMMPQEFDDMIELDRKETEMDCKRSEGDLLGLLLNEYYCL